MVSTYMFIENKLRKIWILYAACYCSWGCIWNGSEMVTFPRGWKLMKIAGYGSSLAIEWRTLVIITMADGNLVYRENSRVLGVKEYQVVKHLLGGEKELIEALVESQWGPVHLFDLCLWYGHIDTALALARGNVKGCKLETYHLEATIDAALDPRHRNWPPKDSQCNCRWSRCQLCCWGFPLDQGIWMKLWCCWGIFCRYLFSSCFWHVLLDENSHERMISFVQHSDQPGKIGMFPGYAPHLKPKRPPKPSSSRWSWRCSLPIKDLPLTFLRRQRSNFWTLPFCLATPRRPASWPTIAETTGRSESGEVTNG